jgi:hypothetical protein
MLLQNATPLQCDYMVLYPRRLKISPPLHLKTEAEAQAGIYKLMCNDRCNSRSIPYGYICKSWDMIKEPILQMETDKMILRYAFHKPFTVKFLNKNER